MPTHCLYAVACSCSPRSKKWFQRETGSLVTVMVLRLYCAALASVTALCLLAPVVVAHTWLIDPPAHYQLFPRNAIVGTPCELYSSNVRCLPRRWPRVSGSLWRTNTGIAVSN